MKDERIIDVFSINLKSNNDYIQLLAIEGFTIYGEKKFSPVLMEAMKYESKDSFIRFELLEALARLKYKPIIPMLVESINRYSFPSSKFDAGRVAKTIAYKMGANYDQVQRYSYKAEEKYSSHEYFVEAIGILGDLSDTNILYTLVKILKNESSDLKQTAIEALNELKNKVQFQTHSTPQFINIME